jgi:hypothetical protein
LTSGRPDQQNSDSPERGSNNAKVDFVRTIAFRIRAIVGTQETVEEEPQANITRAKMTTSVGPDIQKQTAKRATLGLPGRFVRHNLVREFLIVAVFCLFTSILTWPYVIHLRDAVVDSGDPYLISWILWWDYHQTFTNPLHLFDANLFYPLRYTLAFSEHSYGIALLFFPLFALGVKPLTVHAVAMFMGFALSGYGAFRLGRTLTGSSVVGWVAGIVFAFVPYRFHLMSQVAYLFSPWLPLVFEALVLFARERSMKRAAWLGCAFFMSGLTTISWFTFSLIPFALYAGILLTRYGLWRERRFWLRGSIAVGIASVLLLPFMLPYLLASRLYSFQRSIDEIKDNSAWPSHWLSVEYRNRLWRRMGDGLPAHWKFKLFPGLLPILFSLAALPLHGRTAKITIETAETRPSRAWLRPLDILIVVAFSISLLAVGFQDTKVFYGLFDYLTSARMLAFLTVAVVARLCLAYPSFLPSARANLIETLRSGHRCDGFWLGVVLTVIGFCYSLGWNFFFYRICYELIPMFRSMRVVSRGAMVAYLGLALLSGLGVKRLTETLPAQIPWLRRGAVFTAACLLLLVEFNAAPLQLMQGEVNPDGVTLKLKQTPMRGGIVILPAGADYNHRYVLRAADHAKPLIVGTSGFNSPIEDRIEALSTSGTISADLMDLMESVPTSYLVIENQLIMADRKTDYQVFLIREIVSNRLRFINRFDGHSDLYAVVRNEPEARSEAAPPFDLAIPDWSAKIREDSLNILGQSTGWSQTIYRVYLASTGTLPRYADFVTDLEVIGRGAVLGSELQEQQFQGNLLLFLGDWTRRPAFTGVFAGLDDAQYVDRLLQNAGVNMEPAERNELTSELSRGQDTRAGVLLRIVRDPRFIEKENYRSLLLLHYFGYLHRNPDDAPDDDLSGFNFWLRQLERNHDAGKLSSAFQESGEYLRILQRR